MLWSIFLGKSNWWDEPRSIIEIHDFGGDLDYHPNEETMRRLKRTKNVDNEDESNSRIFQTEFGKSYFGERNSKELHDRSKRSRRSFVADINNQRDIPENNNRKTIKDVLENISTTQNTEEVVAKLYSSYRFNDDGKNSVNVLNKMNISDSLDGFLFNNKFNNVTITPLTTLKTNSFGLRYPSNTDLYLNDHIINNKSCVIKTELQTHSLEHITKSEVFKTNSKEISQRSPVKMLKIIDHVTENCTNSPNFEKNIFIDSIHLLITDGADDSEKSLKNRSDEKKLGVATQKISRLGTDDGQSKGAEKEFPRGNTSRGSGIATNKSQSCVVETTVAMRRRVIGTDETQKQNRESIPGVIKVFEPRGRLHQKQEVETAVRLSWRMGKDGTSAEKMKMNEDEIDESRNTNTREDSSTSPIDSVTDATMKSEAAYINTSDTGELILKDLTSVTVGNDLRKQQQMVPRLSVENSNANNSNGNSDTDRIDIRVLGSNGNETMNVKEGTRAIMEAHEYHKFDNNLQRKLLWISTISVDEETRDSSIKGTRSVFNTTTKSHIENVINEDRQQITDSPNLGKVLTTVKREDKAEESRTLRDALNSQISETNHYARYKRSIYPYENLESNNEADSENTAIEKETAINHDEKQESNEEYLNQNVEELKGNYNDLEEDIFEGITLI